MASTQQTLPLDERAPTARTNDPSTARAAGRGEPRVRRYQQRLVLVELARRGDAGATDYALGEACGIVRTSAGKRRKELQVRGFVVDTALRRATDTGSTAIVWRITAAGLAEYAKLPDSEASS